MLKHSSIYAIGNLGRQLVGFLMLPVYTRYLSPSDYGVVGLIVFSISLIELIFGARVFHAVSKFYYEQKTERDSHCIVSTAILLTAIVSIFPMLGMMFLSHSLSQVMFGTHEHSLVVSIFAVLLLTQAMEFYTLGFVRIQQRPWLFVSANACKLVMQLSMNIIFVVVLEFGVLGVAISNAASSLIFASAMTFYTFWHTGVRFSQYVARRLLIFSWPLWLSGLGGLYIGSSNLYYIRWFGELGEVGLFGLAAKLASALTLLVWMPFSLYWQTERFNLYQQPNPVPVYQSVFRFATTILVLAVTGMALFGGPVIRIMAAPEFHRAAEAIPYLAFGGLFQCLTFFTNFSFLVKEKTVWITSSEYITALLATVMYLSLIPLFGFVGAAQAAMSAYAAQFIFVHFAAKRHYDMRLSLRPLTLHLLIAVTAIALGHRLEHSNLVLDIVIKAVIFSTAAVAIAASLLANSNVRDYLTNWVGVKALSKSR